MTRIRIALCALVLLASAAGAEAQQQCSWEEVPRRRSGAAAQRDSAWRAVQDGFRDAAYRAATGAGIAEPRGVVFFSMNPDGSDPVVRSFDGNVPESLLAPLAAGVVERATPQTRNENGRVVIVERLDTLPLAPARADGKRLDCPPVALNLAQLVRQMEAWARAHTDGEFPARPTLVSVVVARNGMVLHAELHRTSGDPSMDRAAVEAAGGLVFRPASLDGVSRDLVARLPVRVIPEEP